MKLPYLSRDVLKVSITYAESATQRLNLSEGISTTPFKSIHLRTFYVLRENINTLQGVGFPAREKQHTKGAPLPTPSAHSGLPLLRASGPPKQ
eukprot:scaffold19153_cov80-Skeletonema_menzelii.AAC.7